MYYRTTKAPDGKPLGVTTAYINRTGRHPMSQQMNAPDSPEALIRAAARNIASRLAGEKGPVGALRSVVHMIDNDEAELAVDDLARVIASYRISITRTEYEQIAAAAAQLDALDSLTVVGVDRFIGD
ncbi:hypothetical protein [Streptomyces sp. NPDC057381]|uniref:hypothetical protein n=1 Tax=Streptomyces sp. NPDC057381 TaxID=3346111 RepID=UPI00363BA833